MKTCILFFIGLFFIFNLHGQVENVKELISEGTALHDNGKYNEAIAKYKAALDIDRKSTQANYELSYTCMTIGKLDDAIKYSKIVIRQNSDNQEEAYVVLGTSHDMQSKPLDAIKTYEEGIVKFPKSNLLNFNLAITAFNTKDYDKAEKAAIIAITAKPTHASSHLVLSKIMSAKGERVRSLLSIYYFLLLEPNSKRSLPNYKTLTKTLNADAQRKDDKSITINVSSSSFNDTLFSPAEMMISTLGANKFMDENKDKSESALFVDSNQSIFSVLGELKKDNKGFWWDFYVDKFYDLVTSGNVEAFSYYISQSANSKEVTDWISKNEVKMAGFKNWMRKY